MGLLSATLLPGDWLWVRVRSRHLHQHLLRRSRLGWLGLGAELVLVHRFSAALLFQPLRLWSVLWRRLLWRRLLWRGIPRRKLGARYWAPLRRPLSQQRCGQPFRFVRIRRRAGEPQFVRIRWLPARRFARPTCLCARWSKPAPDEQYASFGLAALRAAGSAHSRCGPVSRVQRPAQLPAQLWRQKFERWQQLSRHSFSQLQLRRKPQHTQLPVEPLFRWQRSLPSESGAELPQRKR